MRARDVIELLVLSVLWGGAYLFTRAAVPAFGPAPLVSMRLGIAALILLPILLWRGGWPQLRANPRALFMVGVPFTALPFMLMTWGALHITAGLSAVLNATAPMFAALVAYFFGSSGSRVGDSGALQSSGSMQVRIFSRKYSSSRRPYARRWMTRILLLSPSTKPSETLFSGLQ